MLLSVEERLWETQVWTGDSRFDSRRRKFIFSEPSLALRSSQPPVQPVPGSHISRAQSSQDTKLTTHGPAVLRFRMHGAVPPFSIHVIVKVIQSYYRPGQAQRVLRKLRFPDFVTTAQDGGRLSALRTGCLYPQEVLISIRG